MSRVSARLPSSALVVACLALLLALGGVGGAAVTQAPPKNSVGTAQLKSNAVTTPKLKNNAVAAAKIASNAVVAAKIASNAVSSAKIASNAVSSAKIAAGAVTADKVATDAVTTEKVQDGSITAADLAPGVVPPSVALGRFVNGPVAVPSAQTAVATLAIPDPGNYVIWGKAYLTTSVLAGTATCRLEAGSNFDESLTYVAADEPATLSLMVLNNFTAAGNVNFSCSATTQKQANFIKITALRVANLTNSG
jgi:hypothetical protein